MWYAFCIVTEEAKYKTSTQFVLQTYQKYSFWGYTRILLIDTQVIEQGKGRGGKEHCGIFEF